MSLTSCEGLTRPDSDRFCAVATSGVQPCLTLNRGALVGFKSAYLDAWVAQGLHSAFACKNDDNNSTIYVNEDLYAHKTWIEAVMKYE